MSIESSSNKGIFNPSNVEKYYRETKTDHHYISRHFLEYNKFKLIFECIYIYIITYVELVRLSDYNDVNNSKPKFGLCLLSNIKRGFNSVL